MAKKIAIKPVKDSYVFGHPLFADRAVIPPQKLYSDTAYWYDKEKREKLWKSNIPKAEKDFYAPFKGSPYGFAESLPAWYSEHIAVVNIQEFEFSKNTIIRTTFSEDLDGITSSPYGPEFGILRYVSRDVVTGEFQLKSGRLTGTAYSITRQSIDDGRPTGKSTTLQAGAGGKVISEEITYGSQDIFQWRSEQGIPLYGETGLGITWPYDGQWAWAGIDPIQVPKGSDSVGEISIQKFFPDGWERNPFGNNLV